MISLFRWFHSRVDNNPWLLSVTSSKRQCLILEGVRHQYIQKSGNALESNEQLRSRSVISTEDVLCTL